MNDKWSNKTTYKWEHTTKVGRFRREKAKKIMILELHNVKQKLLSHGQIFHQLHISCKHFSFIDRSYDIHGNHFKRCAWQKQNISMVKPLLGRLVFPFLFLSRHQNKYKSKRKTKFTSVNILRKGYVIHWSTYTWYVLIYVAALLEHILSYLERLY